MSKAEEKAQMLIATNYSNKMSLDMRLIDPEYGDNPETRRPIVQPRLRNITINISTRKAHSSFFQT